MKIKHIILSLIMLLAINTTVFAAQSFGVVNFMDCITESKYGKNEQQQLENIKKQWSELIEQTEKDLKELGSKFEDQDYMDSVSPEAEDNMKLKYKALNEDVAKYQNQLYQILNQANYFFIQKMSSSISKASEKIASDRKLEVVLNKEACFYNSPKIDITELVIKEMDRNYENDTAKNDSNKEKESIANLQKFQSPAPVKEVK